MIASDGHFLYIHNAQGLHKVGSGFGATIRGVVYDVNPTLASCDMGWLGFVAGKLFFCRSSTTSSSLTAIDCKTLKTAETFHFPSKLTQESGEVISLIEIGVNVCVFLLR